MGEPGGLADRDILTFPVSGPADGGIDFHRGFEEAQAVLVGFSQRVPVADANGRLAAFVSAPFFEGFQNFQGGFIAFAYGFPQGFLQSLEVLDHQQQPERWVVLMKLADFTAVQIGQIPLGFDHHIPASSGPIVSDLEVRAVACNPAGLVEFEDIGFIPPAMDDAQLGHVVPMAGDHDLESGFVVVGPAPDQIPAGTVSDIPGSVGLIPSAIALAHGSTILPWRYFTPNSIARRCAPGSCPV